MHRELISNALNKRFHELRSRISQLEPDQYGDMLPFIIKLRKRLVDASPAELNQSSFTSMNQDSWFESDTDCLTSFRRLSLGEQLEVRSSQSPPHAPFIQHLDAARRDPELCIQLLTERYHCPFNFAVPSEAEAREYILTRLMVHDRRRIERHSAEAVDSDDLLLRLNLIAVHTSIVPDLRFLDALNYYYELLPATWRPQAQHKSLLITYLALYAQALAAQDLRR